MRASGASAVASTSAMSIERTSGDAPASAREAAQLPGRQAAGHGGRASGRDGAVADVHVQVDVHRTAGRSRDLQRLGHHVVDRPAVQLVAVHDRDAVAPRRGARRRPSWRSRRSRSARRAGRRARPPAARRTGEPFELPSRRSWWASRVIRPGGRQLVARSAERGRHGEGVVAADRDRQRATGRPPPPSPRSRAPRPRRRRASITSPASANRSASDVEPRARTPSSGAAPPAPPPGSRARRWATARCAMVGMPISVRSTSAVPEPVRARTVAGHRRSTSTHRRPPVAPSAPARGHSGSTDSPAARSYRDPNEVQRAVSGAAGRRSSVWDPGRPARAAQICEPPAGRVNTGGSGLAPASRSGDQSGRARSPATRAGEPLPSDGASAVAAVSRGRRVAAPPSAPPCARARPSTRLYSVGSTTSVSTRRRDQTADHDDRERLRDEPAVAGQADRHRDQRGDRRERRHQDRPQTTRRAVRDRVATPTALAAGTG